MIDSDPTEWPVKPPRHRASHVEIYRSFRFKHPNGPNNDRYPEWHWRLVAGNGRVRNDTGRGFTERRKLVDNLEATTHMIMLDQDRLLVGPSWYLYGVQFAYLIPEAWPHAGQVVIRPVIGTVIAVQTQDRHWASRLNRNKP